MFCVTEMFGKTNAYWTNNQEYNLLFLKNQRKYTQDKFDVRGYIYMNEIYEAFGLTWHPEYFNPVFTKDSGRILNVEFTPVERTNNIRIDLEY